MTFTATNGHQVDLDSIGGVGISLPEPYGNGWTALDPDITQALREFFQSEARGDFKPKPRIHSRDVKHLREDLAASLRFAVGVGATFREMVSIRAIVEGLDGYEQTQGALAEVATTLGPQVFGRVALFHLHARTSLSGVSEQLTRPRALAYSGLTVRDLGWPASQLSAEFLPDAVEDPALEARLEAAVDAWRAQTAHG